MGEVALQSPEEEVAREDNAGLGWFGSPPPIAVLQWTDVAKPRGFSIYVRHGKYAN